MVKEKAQRNAQMRALRAQGWTLDAIGRKFGISGRRVGYIVGRLQEKVRCGECNRLFQKRTIQQRWCSPTCRNRHKVRKHYYRHRARPPLTTEQKELWPEVLARLETARVSWGWRKLDMAILVGVPYQTYLAHTSGRIQFPGSATMYSKYASAAFNLSAAKENIRKQIDTSSQFAQKDKAKFLEIVSALEKIRISKGWSLTKMGQFIGTTLYHRHSKGQHCSRVRWKTYERYKAALQALSSQS